MTRKPIDQLKSQNKPHGQDGVWTEVRRKNIFTAAEIHTKTAINKKTVSDYIKRLEAGGYVEKHPSFDETKRFVLVRDAGIHAPRIRADGTPVKQGNGTQNMWRSMRNMEQFTPFDLALCSSTDTVNVSEATAKTYCSMLLRAGYLRVLQKAVPGKRQATYKFIRNTGPQPPQIQRVKQVFDPNLNEVTFYPGAA
ncbi:MarR family winged helix-turn-helix transcriptional regulator [Aliiroseovarius crassostreae]|uniref:MarR family transcriptional regulator n=1 Tax=Aliiroseovarius crassostreae TaxID=154981 RepID=UPI00220A1B9B|nr:MarR family winged helix-turn-helix transcriptional regulator [Aliiroseovarius crassostreae]UWQ00827.1 MarR family winged helix-turn-helix transcriptional regulator [Aliiroseovarius crassostreae]